ncbi:MAG: DNA translocase FtsK 4TM domain-containing protein [Gammaproteobacteria bacterium]|nr:DNA translocase FtsK 4TM domain-containing protein [Gammaproteobacteria bacterium]
MPAGKIPAAIAALLREVGVIALAAVTGYLGLALLTYSPGDPGPTNTGVGGGAVANLGGPVGAWFADVMFTGFGRSAYLFLFLLCALIWRLHRRIEARFGDWGKLLTPAGLALALLGACGLEQIYVGGAAAPASAWVAGGIVGQFSAAQLASLFGLAGAALLLFALLVTGITLATHLSWFALMDRTGYRAFAAAAWLKSAVERRADRRAGMRARKQRRNSVRTLRTDLETRTPPKIAPKIDAAPQGERKQQERQKNLFPAGGDGPDTLPPLSLLEESTASGAGYSRDELQAMSQLLVKKLKDFNIDIRVEAVQPGPVITRFEVDPAPGVKASQIVGLARDLARSLSVESVRVVDNIAGKTVVGIEIPNQSREIVRLVDGLSSRAYEKSASPLTLVLGKDIAGHPAITDLVKMPHVLIAGTTGSGKSVCINALILSVVYKSTPQQVRLIMVDPKFLELSVYDGIPHLLAPVFTDMNKAANALRWCIGEMDRRFRVMAAIGVRNITGYNKKVADATAAGAPLADPLAEAGDGGDGSGDGDGDGGDGENAAAPVLQSLPYIVVVVDELADLMMVVGKKIEEIIIRIAQRARAAGIHLVLATQRPSVDVVTGLIKANVPTRIAFQVSSRADSRTVIDQMGAEQLLGQGDMLFLPPGSGFTQRVHGSFVSDEEVASVVAYLKQSARPVYLEAVTDGDASAPLDPGGAPAEGGGGETDPQYDKAVEFVTAKRRASISLLQRQFSVGYNRAARMMDAMEAAGVVSPPGNNDKREVLAPPPPEA